MVVASDAVPIEDPCPASPPPPGGVGLKLLAVLFILFLVVVSNAFTEGIIARFGPKAMSGRSPTAWGVVLQGFSLTGLFALATYLTGQHIL